MIDVEVGGFWGDHFTAIHDSLSLLHSFDGRGALSLTPNPSLPLSFAHSRSQPIVKCAENVKTKKQLAMKSHLLYVPSGILVYVNCRSQ